MSEFSPLRARGYEIRPSTIPVIPSLSLFLLLLAAYISRSSPITEITLWIVFVSALVSSIAGFAFSPIAGAVLFYANPDSISVVQVLLVASLSQQLYCVWQLRDQIKSFEFIPYSMGGLAALPIGILLLFNWQASAFLPMLGLFLCAYGSFIALRPTVPCFKSNPLAGRILAGALGGITGGLAAFPGAFVVIWSHVQGFEKLRQRSIVQPYILINQAVAVATLFYLRPVATTYLDAVQYAAPAVLGAYFGMNIFRKLGTEGFNRTVGYSLAFAGLLMAAKAI